MPKFYIEMTIEFAGEIEAESKEAAEALAWESWGDSMDSDITYQDVVSIDVEEVPDEEEEDE
jgi:hypothetical protein